MFSTLSKRYRYSLILLRELVITDFKLRYQDSFLGYLWALLRPLFMFAIIYLVFTVGLRVGKGIEHWPAALLLGMVLWHFFTEITKQGMKSIVKNGGIIRKINFPKYIIVVSTSISALINLAINLVVVVVIAAFNGVDFTWSMLWIIPLIAEIYIFALGIAFLFSAISVKFRDVDYIWDIATQALFYGSAIIFPISTIAEKSAQAAQILLINPVAQVIQDARHLAINPAMTTQFTLTDNMWYILAPFIITSVTFVVGATYFRSRSPYFAEDV
jgi:ABC-2 type transport system permease protein